MTADTLRTNRIRPSRRRFFDCGLRQASRWSELGALAHDALWFSESQNNRGGESFEMDRAQAMTPHAPIRRMFGA